MLISYSWLNDYVKLDMSPKDLAELLTMGGLEEESTVRIGPDLDGVVVGHVLRHRKHPNADKLSVCDVDLGTGEPVQIVCGAPNVAAGQFVPVATVGTTLNLPDKNNPGDRVPFTLKKVKIRGEESSGMICSEMELGISEDHSGSLGLDKAENHVGHAYSAYLQDIGQSIEDWVTDIAITPNRPDAISHIGVARDIAAFTGKELCVPDLNLERFNTQGDATFEVKIECPETCRRYVGILVRDVEVAESPEWLQRRLIAVGLRPRNNIVDITNYVMYECGQPLHGFDFDLLDGKQIIVRQTHGSSEFTTLDDQKRNLPAGTMMICDATRPVAIAGVMGGENSEVSDSTTNVLIESAWFDPSNIRRTAKALDLATDASYRFERGVDSDGQVWAAVRAAELMADIAGGTIDFNMVDAHPNPVPETVISVRPERARSLIGAEISDEEMDRLLSSIGFEVSREDHVLVCRVPSFRPDVLREVDVIEEIVRLFGYDNVPAPASSSLPFTMPERPFENLMRTEILKHLRGLGFRETFTNSLLNAEIAKGFHQTPGDDAPVVETLRPVSREMAVLRPSLLPGILKVISHNQNHGQDQLRLVEFGNVFTLSQDGGTTIPGYSEHESLILAWSGIASEASWSNPERLADVFDLKGVIENVLTFLNLNACEFDISQEPDPLDRFTIQIRSGNKPLGKLSLLASATGDSFDLRHPVYYAELNWTELSRKARRKASRSYTPIPRTPVVERDLALIVDSNTPAGALLSTIRAAGGNLLKDVRIFDVYEGENIPDGRKSLAFSLRIGADKTLVDKEIDKLIKRIVGRVAHEHKAELR